MIKRILLAIAALLVLIYVFGPTPPEPQFDSTLPIMPTGLEELNGWVANHENRPDIKPGNEAQIYWADDSSRQKTEYVLLYLHGFTASKQEGMPLFLDFAKRYGMNTYAARLATQGLDTPDAMIDYRPERLWETTKQAFAIAKNLGDKVIIMSTSTGGTLALMLAATYGEDVHSLINLSPNIRPRDPKSFLLNKPWGLQISRLVLGGDFRELEKKDTIYEKYWYRKYRIEALVYLEELVETTMNTSTFEQITCPVLNLYYYRDEENQDPVVDVERIKWMHENLSTPENLKRAVPIQWADTHVIGCGIYSQSIDEVALAAFSFAEEVLMLKPVNLAP